MCSTDLNFYYAAYTNWTPSNAALVEKGIKILQTLGKEPASAQEAREILGLKKLVN